MKRLLKQLMVTGLLVVSMTLFLIPAGIVQAAAGMPDRPTLPLVTGAPSGAGTTTVPLSSSTCDALLKQNTHLTRVNCFVTIKSTTTKLSNSLHPLNSSSCPTGDVRHENYFYGPAPLALYGAAMKEVFHFKGDCSAPDVKGQNCYYDDVSIFPYDTSTSGCTNYPYNNTAFAEGDYKTCEGIGFTLCFNTSIITTADGRSGHINDSLLLG